MNIRLRPVTYDDLSGLSHNVLVSENTSDSTLKVLLIQYKGLYKAGAAGKGDALYIVAAAKAAQAAWWAPCTVIDFRELEYNWGDEMEWVASIGWDPVTRCQLPLAIVVGERCRKALQSLLEEQFERLCVDTLEQAFDLCRLRENEWRLQVKDWHKRRGLNNAQ